MAPIPFDPAPVGPAGTAGVPGAPATGVLGALPAAIALDDALGGLVVSGMVLFIGLALMKRAFDRRRQRQLIEETPTEDVESLSIGPSEVAGTAVPAEGAIRAPFSEDDCLVARWRVEEFYQDKDSSGWNQIASGVECTPFYVDDGTGRLLVVPDEEVVYEIDGDDERRVEVGAFERTPEAIAEFVGQRRGLDPFAGHLSTVGLGGLNLEFGGLRDGFTFGTGGRAHGRRRYYQDLLQPGEDVYVFGTVQLKEGARSSSNPENLVIKRVPKGDEDLEPLFMIADRPEASLTRQRRFSLLWFPVGALLATAGVGGVVFVASLLLGIDLQVA